jgi:formylglycine-generating enzyme required for sulfatase activity
VGAGFRNVYGVRDLHGGAWEWTREAAVPRVDHATAHATAHTAAHEHMPSCASAAIGASDQTNYPAFLRYAFRAALNNRATVLTLGFRCAAG